MLSALLQPIHAPSSTRARLSRSQMGPQGAGNFSNPQSMFLTATATCMLGLLPEQSLARLCLTGANLQKQSPARNETKIVVSSPLLAFPPGSSCSAASRKSRGASRKVGEVPIVPPVVGDILEADPQAPLPHRWPRIAQRGSP